MTSYNSIAKKTAFLQFMEDGIMSLRIITSENPIIMPIGDLTGLIPERAAIKFLM